MRLVSTRLRKHKRSSCVFSVMKLAQITLARANLKKKITINAAYNNGVEHKSHCVKCATQLALVLINTGSLFPVEMFRARFL